MLGEEEEEHSPCSLPYATREPLKVTPPMYVPRYAIILVRLAAGSVAKCGYSTMYSATQVSTAAKPTRLWKAATN